MAQCPHCMSRIHDEATTCPQCGARKESPIAKRIGCFIICVICAPCAFGLFAMADDSSKNINYVKEGLPQGFTGIGIFLLAVALICLVLALIPRSAVWVR